MRHASELSERAKEALDRARASERALYTNNNKKTSTNFQLAVLTLYTILDTEDNVTSPKGS